ncbi:MAG TPA: HD domain-containing phosphohydrolase [Gemmatimonadaceae bacterium]|nr:HD domain-containing phosphohydrolase [Gemmatimonadaceae bacterium]
MTDKIERTPTGRVLVVEDDPSNARMLTRLLCSEGYTVETAADGQEALDVIAKRPPDVLLLDVMLPTIDGFEVCRRVKADPATRLTPVVFLTGLDAGEHRIAGINVGADDFLSKPFNTEELRARVRSLVQLKHFTDELESAESVILSLALTVEARDSYTNGHCHRLAAYATALGAELAMSREDLGALRRGAYLHDVGKIGIPDSVLLKPATLTPEEYSVMQRHAVIGDALCGDMRSLAPVRAIVRHHHERLDGSGYPDGLSGDDIPVVAQIVGIVDAYDAMTTSRPYRGGRSAREACLELGDDARRGRFNPQLVQSFIGLLENGRVPPYALRAGGKGPALSSLT